jgi:hypothetical protein
MPAQIRRLVDLTKQPNITLDIITARSEWTVPPLHGFVLTDDSQVEIDLINTAITSRGRSDVMFYHRVFDDYVAQSAGDAGVVLGRHLNQLLDRLHRESVAR